MRQPTCVRCHWDLDVDQKANSGTVTVFALRAGPNKSFGTPKTFLHTGREQNKPNELFCNDLWATTYRPD